jgi:hypothetical protein
LHRYYKKVLAILSPSVQGEIACIKHSGWIKQIPFFCSPIEEEHEAFTAAIATKLGAEAFSPNEGIYMEGAMASTLFVVERGIASLECAIMSHNKAFGLEMIMHAGVRQHQAVALTYLDCITLSNADLYEVMELGGWAFVTIKRLIRQEAIRLSMRQAMREICQASRLLHGFAMDQRLMSMEEVRQTRKKYHDRAEKKHELHQNDQGENELSQDEKRDLADRDMQVRAKREAALMLHFWGSDVPDDEACMKDKDGPDLSPLKGPNSAALLGGSGAGSGASPSAPSPALLAPAALAPPSPNISAADGQLLIKLITNGFAGLNARVDTLEKEFEKVHAAKPKSGNHDVLRAHLTRLRTSHLTREEHQNKLHDHFTSMKH